MKEKLSKQEWKQMFDMFLLENNCHHQFYKNIYIEHGCKIPDDLFMYPSVIVDNAFYFEGTNEKFNFWSSISSKWDDELSEVSFELNIDTTMSL